MEILVARQAIFDRARKVYGYELLFRRNAEAGGFDGTEAAAATMQVLSNTVMIGAENLLGGKKAFVNFDHRLLGASMHQTLPKELIVIEILETVEPTPELAALCQAIRGEGYTLALDDFAGDRRFDELAGLADVIKVDMQVSSRAEQEAMLRRYKPRGVTMLAEKVETPEEFEWAHRAGYDLFQGYFFARPVLVRSKQIPAAKAACMRLLKEGQRAELDFHALEKLIRADVGFTHKLLRYVNSAGFEHREEIQSIGSALMLMGEEGTRRWITIATLPALATNKPGELAVLSLTRARFCERMAELGGCGCANEAFLMGMFSLLDALIDQPLDRALSEMELASEITDPLLGVASERDFLGGLYGLIRDYEKGDWEAVAERAKQRGIAVGEIADAYVEATGWASQFVK